MRSISRGLTVATLSALAVLPTSYVVHATAADAPHSATARASDAPPAPGGWVDADRNDPGTHTALAAAVTQMNTPAPTPAGSRYVVEDLKAARVQVVAGLNYAFDYRAALLVGDELTARVHCVATVWVQSWANSIRVTALTCVAEPTPPPVTTPPPPTGAQVPLPATAPAPPAQPAAATSILPPQIISLSVLGIPIL